MDGRIAGQLAAHRLQCACGQRFDGWLTATDHQAEAIEAIFTELVDEWESYTGDPKRGDVWQYCADQLRALAAVGVPADQEAEKVDLFVADRHRLAGWLDACLDGLGHTEINAADWLAEFEADFPAPVPADQERNEQ